MKYKTYCGMTTLYTISFEFGPCILISRRLTDAPSKVEDITLMPDSFNLNTASQNG